MRSVLIPGCLATFLLGIGQAQLSASTIIMGLLGDPGHSHSFARTGTPVGQIITEPVGQYPGCIGFNTEGNRYSLFCIDSLKTANWNTAYTGTLQHVGDDIPGKTREQVVEAAYLSDWLYQLGGMDANTDLYQGPISYAIWQIMDPAPGHVQRNPAAQPYIQEAQYMWSTGRISASLYPKTMIFVPHDPAIQDFMTLSAVNAPEPGPVVLVVGGLALIGVGRIRRRNVNEHTD